MYTVHLSRKSLAPQHICKSTAPNVRELKFDRMHVNCEHLGKWVHGEYAAPTCGGIPNSQVSISLWGQTPSFIWSAPGARKMYVTTFQGANKLFDQKYFKLQFFATQPFVWSINHRSHNHKASSFLLHADHCIACVVYCWPLSQHPWGSRVWGHL